MEATPAVVVPERRLGKMPPKFDARTLRAETYVRPKKLVIKTKVVDRMSRVLKVAPYPMLANDRLGDCVFVAMEHIDLMVGTWGHRAHVSDADREARTIARYSRVTGYVPGNPATDNGGYLLDSLKDAQHNGLDGQGNDKIGPYFAVDPTNEAQMVAVLHILGTLYTGVMLPVSAQQEPVWKTTTGAGSEPGSWGGHAIMVGRITTKARRAVTWGAAQEMTEEWQGRYMDEAWSFIDEDFIREASKKTVTGLDLAGLMADYEELRRR